MDPFQAFWFGVTVPFQVLGFVTFVVMLRYAGKQ